MRLDRTFVATAVLFLTEAIVFASWLPRIPEVQASLQLGPGGLGIVLGAMPVGALAAMPLAGALATRLDPRRMNLLCMGWLIAATLLIPLASTPILFSTALLLVGIGTGSMGVAMNTTAIEVEKALRRPILSRCHAFFSVGVALGGAVGGQAAWANMSFAAQQVTVGAFAALLLAAVQTGLPLSAQPASGKPLFAIPKRVLLVPAGIAFLCLMAEGAALDWSAVLIAERFVNQQSVGSGVVAFGSAMAVARFGGGWLFGRFGGRAILATGAALAAAGFLLAALGDSVGLVVAGFALAGLGLACVVPIVFRFAGDVDGIAPAVGVAAVSSVGYLGFLGGPPLIGLVSEATRLGTAFGLLSLAMLTVAALSTRMLKNE